MTGFARVVVNVPSLAGVFIESEITPAFPERMAFDYEVPSELDHKIEAGHLVIVPFSNRSVYGIVLARIHQPRVARTRSVLQLVDSQPALNPMQLSLAAWLSESTLSPMGAVTALFLPPGLAQQADTLFALRESTDSTTGAATSGISRRLLELLGNRGPLRARQIDRHIPRVEWRRTAQMLVRRGVLTSQSVLPPARVRPKYVRTAQLAVPPSVTESALDDLGATQVTRSRRRKALEFLTQKRSEVDVSWVYAASGCTLADLQELAERDLIALREQEAWRDPLAGSMQVMDIPQRSSVEFTAGQETVWNTIAAALADARSGTFVPPFLLRGVTGSGKTELYLRAAVDAAHRGLRSLVLVPEIALTPQTVQRFLEHFPGEVGLIHSRLSDGERYDTWRRARSGAFRVMIGPRSALFSPLPDMGLIVVDECHDASYHQAEPPFYDAVAAAQQLARLSSAVCILGSATPSVVQHYRSQTGELTRLDLPLRIAQGAANSPAPSIELPAVTVVNMRDELKSGNRGSFSHELNTAMAAVLARGQQAILYLNRRGTATHVFCRNCGHVVRCPRCDTPLTLHSASSDRLLCHRCMYQRAVPRKCPQCGGPDIRGYGLGTEKVEAELQQAFPKVRALRWDSETTRHKNSHEIILHHFAAGRADVLIGTQMLAKGLDLPRVTLVGIVMADVGLFLPDPFAPERVFQLLTQVAGRAGRSALGGRVVLQTFAPDHYVIQAARQHDVAAFNDHELAQRRRLGFPPFTRLLRLEFRHHDEATAEATARALATKLKRRASDLGALAPAMIGPAPCFFRKLDGRFRWQIVLRGGEPETHLTGLRLADWRIERDPVSLL